MKSFLKYCNYEYIRYLFYQILFYTSFLFALHFMLFAVEKNYLLTAMFFVLGFVGVVLQHRSAKPKLSKCLDGTSMSVSVFFPVVFVSSFALMFSALFAKELVFDRELVGSIGAALLFGCIGFYFWRCKKKFNDNI